MNFYEKFPFKSMSDLEVQIGVLGKTQRLNVIHIYFRLTQNKSMNDKIMDLTRPSI